MSYVRTVLVEHPRGGLAMDVRAAGEGVAKMLVTGDVGDDAQLDLRIVRGEQRDLRRAGDEGTADAATQVRSDGDVLEVRIR